MVSRDRVCLKFSLSKCDNGKSPLRLRPLDFPNDYHEHFFPDPDTCNEYFICQYGDHAQNLTCPDDLLFNPNTLQCDFSYNVDCRDASVEKLEKNHCAEHSADRHYCSKYYFCFDDRQREFSCPEGFHFDPLNNFCTTPDKAGCRATPDCPAEGFHVLPHAVDCRKYFFCVNGFPHVQSCGPELLFDYKASECRVADGGVCFHH
ncbi:protein obstructor-E-like [Phlebotomus argentipes]|uniref:protein obstructor-E-like n=1 Tax=Phlebotomus argentipes TaxID=94469 RepID=UPI00289316EB|nr:protein obstructor-E-like [Phlebotomus argentipes]